MRPSHWARLAEIAERLHQDRPIAFAVVHVSRCAFFLGLPCDCEPHVEVVGVAPRGRRP
jgi:hypothetical protein